MSETKPKRSLLGRLFGRGGDKLPQPAADAVHDDGEVAELPEETYELEEESGHEPPVRETGSEVDSAVDVVRSSPAEFAAPERPEPEPEAIEAAPAPAPARKLGWFARLTSGLAKTSARLTEGIAGVFTKRKLDGETLEELEDLLIQADLGLDTAMRITESLRKSRYDKTISPEEVRAVLAAEIERVLLPVARPLVIDGSHKPHVVLVVGVNGTGKTTTIGKLARQYVDDGKQVVLAAGDTFRAAAIEQLKIWGERTGCPVVTRAVGADAAGLAFDALTGARDSGADVLLMDTAGRLQNKQALMAELEKIIRVMRKVDPTAPHDVVLVLDATTGQNALNQVEVFQQRAGVTGLVMTKLDGTARGGILVAISAKYAVPVHAIGVGEAVEDLQPFVASEFARAITLS